MKIPGIQKEINRRNPPKIVPNCEQSFHGFVDQFFARCPGRLADMNGVELKFFRAPPYFQNACGDHCAPVTDHKSKTVQPQIPYTASIVFLQMRKLLLGVQKLGEGRARTGRL
jgi:hypothetical protein